MSKIVGDDDMSSAAANSEAARRCSVAFLLLAVGVLFSGSRVRGFSVTSLRAHRARKPGMSTSRSAPPQSPSRTRAAITMKASETHEPPTTTTASTSGTDATIVVPRFSKNEKAIPGMDDNEEARGVFEYPSRLHYVHVRRLLSSDEASRCLDLATDYGEKSGKWDSPDSDRHASYATCDFPVEECDDLVSYLGEIRFHRRVWDMLADLYGLDNKDMDYLDFFCAHYRSRTESNSQVMDRLEPHRDGSVLSYTITLTPPDQFCGGGTVFDALRDVDPNVSINLVPGGVVRPTRAGDAVIHSGKLLHGADAVTSGTRTVLVGFVEVAEWCLRRGVLFTACRDWGRMDVAAARYKRQMLRTRNGADRGWFLNNARWLHDTNVESGRGRSHVRGFCPAFPSVERRAQGEYQRRKKLEAEDILLRSILLPKNMRDTDRILLEGDVTILD